MNIVSNYVSSMNYERLRDTELFQDLDGCESIVDDIIIWGESEKQHDQRLFRVLDSLDEKNLKLNKEKCEFKKTSLT
ncbi:hypothetical protein DPMN_194544 [Dreissena polymorpha]|uniref:Reverse transcriptase n=1 Tax=Dreissena polymorpha TaxID=45954 RepID=A0A9D3Y546_DREPO|nr:hypothetical protein DPMN_194544 [Dreissena polymorpha]